MAPASNEEQFKFLISCIRYSNNGKVDFGQVAKECNIVSKGAAAKRYERMMRAHGIAPNAASIKPAPSRPKSECRDSSIPLKKRKAEQFLEDAAADDDELVGWGTIKEDPHARDEKALVFKELKTEGGTLNLEQAANLMQYYDNGSQLVVDDLYGAGDFGGGMAGYGTSSGYATPMGSAHGLDSQGGYFAAPYTSSAVSGMSSMSGMGGLSSVPRSSPQSFQYQQHSLPYQPKEQGHSDSPLIVE
ncbi:hypothetical protein N431DRAFT_535641 [Stipitochalara longipes BDJ]|nr:hypothetical protein N431DRAFT_535641 [Stipitochalara longipes BDJ]